MKTGNTEKIAWQAAEYDSLILRFRSVRVPCIFCLYYIIRASMRLRNAQTKHFCISLCSTVCNIFPPFIRSLWNVLEGIQTRNKNKKCEKKKKCITDASQQNAESNNLETEMMYFNLQPTKNNLDLTLEVFFLVGSSFPSVFGRPGIEFTNAN